MTESVSEKFGFSKQAIQAIELENISSCFLDWNVLQKLKFPYAS